MSRPLAFTAVALVSVVAGFFIHTAWDHYEAKSKDDTIRSNPDPEEFHLGMKGFVNPLLDCSPDSVSSIKEAQIRESVETFIADQKAKGAAKVVSVYFRDLNNGPTFGIESQELYSPASLLKVPIMISYLHKAEDDPGLLKKTIKFEAKKYPEGNVHQNIEKPDPLIDGRDYTIEELIDRMITQSDNFAASMLAEQPNVGPDVEKTLREMGVPLVIQGNNQVWLTVKNYASMFRILYNTTYLDQSHSSRALEMLSKSVYEKGLVAGLPNGMTVAHKFGERAVGDDYQLHDCGIVYVPKTPYLLCVMSRGKTFDDLAKVIHGISEIVYKQVIRQ